RQHMRALAISGGGSRGAYAGGVAQRLIETQRNNYDICLGSSTGSLLLPHLALGEVQKIKEIFTNVSPTTIFDVNPFIIKRKGNREYVSIRHWNVLWQLLRNKRTFGESKALRKTIGKYFTQEEYNRLKNSS